MSDAISSVKSDKSHLMNPRAGAHIAFEPKNTNIHDEKERHINLGGASIFCQTQLS